MKTKRVLLLMVLIASISAQCFAQTTVGRQKVDQYPVTEWGTLTYGLTWLPTDYNTNTTQKYPLIIFLHGAGECGDGIGGLSRLVSTALPMKIAQGWDPEAVNPVDGQNYKFIVVSPQAPAASHWSYSYGSVKNILPDIIARYRIDTTRMYVTGLSAGGAGTWGCVTNDPVFARKFPAIVPVSAAGTNTPTEALQLPLVGGVYGVKVWNVCGANDAWMSFANTATNTINAAIPAPAVPAIVSGIPGADHQASAWNTAYERTWRSNSQNLNIYEWMLKYKLATNAPSAYAGVNQNITLPTSDVTVNGTGTPASGNSISSYGWTKVSGPASYNIVSPSSASTQITGLTQGTYVFRLTVTDNLGVTATSDITIVVNAAPNTPPVASAGTDQTITLPLNAVVLNGGGTDADGTIASYTWSKISGPSTFTLTNASSAQANAGGLVRGVYQFELRVTDNGGASAKDTVSITVFGAPNTAPSANAGADLSITLPTNSVTLNGGGTDNDGTITNYSWTKISGPSQFTIVNANAAQTAVNNLAQGIYLFELTVTDDSSASAKDTIAVTVNAALNVAPFAHAGADQSITLPVNNVTLNGSGTDNDGSISSYSWSKISGPAAFTIVSSTSAQTDITGLAEGTYAFELTVTDNDGAIGKDTVMVVVNATPPPPPNAAPTANAGSDQTITLPVDSVILNGSGTDADGTISSYSWTKISGPSQFVIVSPMQGQTTVNSLVFGTYQFELTVTDNNGEVGTDTVTITVDSVVTTPTNIAPVADAGLDQIITLPADSATLSGNGTDADGTVMSFEWKKISGPSSFAIADSSQEEVIVKNLTPGVYVFELTVTDNNGAEGRDTVTVTVNAAAAANLLPVASAGNDTSIMLPVDSIALQGAGTDADGTITGFLWRKLSGPAGSTLQDSTQAQTTANGLAEGIHVFELTVTDNSGDTSSDTVQITVTLQVNLDPVADAGRDTTLTLPDNSVSITGSGSDADGIISAYSWSKVSGPVQYTIATPDQPQTAITNLAAGVYKFELMVTDSQGAIGRDTVTITVNPGAAAVTCAGTKKYIIPGGDGGRYFNGADPSSMWYMPINPGDTLVLKSQYSWSYFSLENYSGTATCPIVVINEGGQVWMTAGIETKSCKYVKITGSGDANTYYGFKIYNPGNDGAGVALSIQGKAKVIEVERIDVYKKTYGVWAKQDPLCDPAFNYPNYTMDSIEIHHSRFRNIGQDCIYAGNTDPTGQRTMWCNGSPMQFIPMRISNVNIHHLIIDSCNRTGIQVSGADAGYNQVHNNIITNCGYEYNQQQGTGISLGGMTKNCHVYNNYIKNTFLYGILSLGAGVNYIENNTIDSSGWLDGVPNNVSRPANIVCMPRTTIPFDSTTIIIRYNKLGVNATTDTSHIAVTNWGPPTWTLNNVVCNNTRLNGTTPAILSIPATIHYIDDCSIGLPNMPPTAYAGNNITLQPPADSTMLHGSGSDPDGSIVSYRWTKISGPSQFVIANPDSANTSITGLVQGVYTFRLTVMDDDTLSASDDIQVSVWPPNVAPIANAGANQIITLPPNTATMNGSGIDPDGTISSYLWTKVSGPSAYSIANPSDPQTQITGLVQGIYMFELKVTDNLGAEDVDTIRITVNPAPPPTNLLPVANAGNDQTITLPTNFATLDGSGTDADGSVISYSWAKISGPASFGFGNASQAQTMVGNLTEGVYQFELTVTDDQGAVAKDIVVITVNAGINVAPFVNSGNDIFITLPVNSVSFNGMATDANGTVTSYQWTKIFGPPSFNITAPSQSQTTVTNLVAGVYHFELMVTDNDGAIARDSLVVTVNPAVPPANIPPVADAGNDQTITQPIDIAALNGSGTDADGTVVAYTWLKISGPTQFTIGNASTPQTSAGSLVPGIYHFELNVTDDGGITSKDTVTITVNAAPPPPNVPPVANAGNDQSITLPVNSVNLIGSGTDADGSVVSYQWSKISGPLQFTIVSSTQPATQINNLVQGTYRFELLVTDNQGATGTDTVTITVNATPNVPPVANAGPDQTITLPVSTVQVNGTGIDTDGVIASYQWTKIAGPATFTIGNAFSAQTFIHNLVAGTYQFELTVTDDRGGTGKDTMTVVVNAAPINVNTPPVADAGNDQSITLPSNGVNLLGSATDADGFIMTYTWTKISGPAQFNIAASSQPQTSVTNLVEGTYMFELRVRDNRGAVGRDTVTVVVNPQPMLTSTAMVYPSPAKTTINVKIDAITHRNYTNLKIYDARGQLVHQEEFIRAQQVIVRTVDVTMLLPGVYIVEVGVDINKTATVKFIKE